MTMQYYAHLQRNHALIFFYQPNDGNSENTYIYNISICSPWSVTSFVQQLLDQTSYWTHSCCSLLAKKTLRPRLKKGLGWIGSRELAANPVTIKLCWFDELCWLPSIRIRLTNCVASPDHYPLVMINIAIEHGHRNSEFSYYKWWFSIVM